MPQVRSTRLRYIKASSLDVLSSAVDGLPFKVEIKGNPVKDGRAWVIWFVIPDEHKFNSVDLTSVD